jgi:hypothetical protein
MTDTYSRFSQVIGILLIPPLLAGVWCLLFWVWTGVLGNTNQPWARRWLASGFWAVMGGLYAIGIGMFVYVHFIR